ncbi:MAG: tetratricopeptide repeat protein [Sphingomonas bacterium]|nr:tetratricopeptide repeat protein [Sphingomonas bacterium]
MLLALPLTAATATPNMFVEARTADAVGDQARAARLFAQLAERDPANRDLSRRAVSTAIEAGETALALSVARRMAPDVLGLDGRLLIVADLLARGRAKDALEVINERTSDSDGGFLAPVLRGWAEQQARKDGSARLINIPADSLLAPFVAEQRAAMLLSRKRVAEALPLIDKALEVGGRREVRLRLAFAAALAKAGERDRAKALLVGEDPALKLLDLDRPQRGIAIDTPAAGLAELLTGIAIGLARGDDRALPLSLVQIARHADPASSEAHLLGALLLEQRGRRPAALAALGRIPADDPFAEDALDATARVLVAEKRGGEALALAQRSAARRGASAGDYARLGNVFDELNRHAEAADAFARGGALADRDQTANRWSYRLLGAAQLDKVKRWPEARAQLELGLKASPEQPLLLNYLGYNSVERGENLDAAEAMIRRALALRPDDPSITDSLGWALYKRGRLPEAIATLQKASIADPAQSEINEHLGDALYDSGRRYEARFAWRAALVTAEAAPERARIEAKLGAGLTKATAAP